MKLTIKDRDLIRGLMRSSAETKNMISKLDADAILNGDHMAMIKAARGRNISVRLHSDHNVVYDIDMGNMFPTPMEHLSVTHPKAVNETDVMTIAKEFGMSDRTKWAASMPPSGPIRGYHIYQEIKGLS